MATTCDDRVPNFTNFGKRFVDLAAPGSTPPSDILSTVLNKHYSYWQGTSMAAAFVAGAAGVLRAKNPALKAADTKAILLATSDPLKVLKNMCGSGGRLNLDNAVAGYEPRSLANRIRRFLGIRRE